MRRRGATFTVTLDAYSIRISWREHDMVKGVIVGGKDCFGEEFKLG